MKILASVGPKTLPEELYPEHEQRKKEYNYKIHQITEHI